MTQPPALDHPWEAPPGPGTVTEVAVAPGQTVAPGDTCVVIEAMKMLHTLISPADATVAEVTVAVGDQVASHQVLVTFDTDHADHHTDQPSDTDTDSDTGESDS